MNFLSCVGGIERIDQARNKVVRNLWCGKKLEWESGRVCLSGMVIL